MQTTMAVEDIKLTLPEPLDSVSVAGGEWRVAGIGRPSAGLALQSWKVASGGCREITIIADDEDHLKDFGK